MRGINFLKLSSKRKRQVMAYGKKHRWTWCKLEREYKQPRWCMYPDAIRGMMGCWSLISMNDVESKSLYKRKCDSCEESKHYNKAKYENCT